MIEISKSSLYECIEIYLLANTPVSLLNAYRNRLSDIITKINAETNLSILIGYFDSITSRGKRTPLVMGLSYLLLIAILLHNDYSNKDVYYNFFQRLEWGIEIAEYINASNTPLAILDLKGIPIKLQKCN